ncbi:hypothetical protein OFC18_30740, partial [Escherichia coli]|nr:hypothetical protein [Escherichia coli]
VGIAVNELRVVWFDEQVYVGQFEVVSPTGKDTSAGDSFPQLVVAAQLILAKRIEDYQRRSGDATYPIVAGQSPTSLPPAVFDALDIT